MRVVREEEGQDSTAFILPANHFNREEVEGLTLCDWSKLCVPNNCGDCEIEDVPAQTRADAVVVFNAHGIRTKSVPRVHVLISASAPLTTGTSSACGWAALCPATPEGGDIRCAECPAHQATEQLTREEAVAWWEAQDEPIRRRRN